MSDAAPLLERVRRRALGGTPVDARCVRLRQRGAIRLDPRRWRPFTADQTLEVSTPGFLWKARVRMAPLLSARVVDSLEAGRGLLEARVGRVLRVAHAEGPETDAAELQRYLAELPWCPQAYANNPHLGFDRKDAHTLRVGADLPGGAVHVDLRVDEAGDVVEARTGGRWRLEGSTQVKRPWSGTFSDHATLAGVRVPTRCRVRWHLEDGPFEYFRAEVTDYALEPARPERPLA